MKMAFGWDSAETAATVAHNLHITAIIVLGLLFLSEGLALVYDTRKDHLLSAAAAKAEAQRKSDADAAETRRKAEVGALQERLNEASSKVAELDKLRQPRRFTPEQRAKLAEFVTKNTTGKLKFVIKASAMADDASAYANEIASAFNAPPISWQVRVDSAIIAGPTAYGIWMSCKRDDCINGDGSALHTILSAADIAVKTEVVINKDMPDDEPIWLNVGPKR